MPAYGYTQEDLRSMRETDIDPHCPTPVAVILAQVSAANPSAKYVASKKGNAIGGWNAELGRYQMVASLTLTGQWVAVPFEILINGQPPFHSEDWETV